MEVAAAIIVLHWGGFTGGGPGWMAPHVQALRTPGTQVVAPAYPLGDPRAAERAVVRLAREHRRAGRRVIVYGTSAGGTLALRLGQRRTADAVVAVAPVVDLLVNPNPMRTWTDEDAAAVSPARRRCGGLTRRTALIVHARNDEVAPYDLAARFARRCRTRFVPLRSGGHEIVLRPYSTAVRFVRARARSR